MATLVFLAAAAASSPVPPKPGITAEQAMAHYQGLVRGAISDPAATGRCSASTDNTEIVVCRRDVHPQPRLPMPDARAEPGEVVHHIGEPPTGDPGPPRTPSRLGDTLMKGFHLLKSAVTGEDPVE